MKNTNEISDFCRWAGITEEQFYGREKVGGDLDLGSLTSIPEGFNPTVGGYLYLQSLTSIPEGFNPTVGGYLYLRSKQEYIGATVDISQYLPEMYSWRNGKYIKVDGIFTEVLSHKGNVYRVKRIGKKEVRYLVTDGHGKWAHGDTLEEARKDLIYKISSRDKSKYESMTRDSILTFEEAIECYRIITGACAMGTKHFVEDILGEKNRKEQYTIAEIIELTKGQYGANAFAEFFRR